MASVWWKLKVFMSLIEHIVCVYYKFPGFKKLESSSNIFEYFSENQVSIEPMNKTRVAIALNSYRK